MCCMSWKSIRNNLMFITVLNEITDAMRVMIIKKKKSVSILLKADTVFIELLDIFKSKKLIWIAWVRNCKTIIRITVWKPICKKTFSWQNMKCWKKIADCVYCLNETDSSSIFRTWCIVSSEEIFHKNNSISSHVNIKVNLIKVSKHLHPVPHFYRFREDVRYVHRTLDVVS